MTNNFNTLSFLAYIKDMGLPKPEQEFHIYIRGKEKGERPCRLDFSWPDIFFAVEIEGGDIWRGKSRHTSGTGYIRDMKKYNWLSKNGWILLRYTWSNIDYNEIKETYKSLVDCLEKMNKIVL